MRRGKIERNTKETEIFVELNLDGTGEYEVSTGIGFLDHMIEQFSRHSLIDLKLSVKGDLHVDQHHTTEDSAIVLGQAIKEALGDKAGIVRYGSAYSPMDETLSRVALDISGSAISGLERGLFTGTAGRNGYRIVQALVPQRRRCGRDYASYRAALWRK